jgi:hypothetical protein
LVPIICKKSEKRNKKEFFKFKELNRKQFLKLNLFSFTMFIEAKKDTEEKLAI